MSSEEKAKDLIKKFNKAFWMDERDKSVAKSCALICVDEILKDKMVLGGDYKFDEFESAKFWESVRDAITKM